LGVLEISLSEKAGYVCGRLSAKVVLEFTGYKTVTGTCVLVDKVARLHKIKNHIPEVVTENVFECLKYID